MQKIPLHLLESFVAFRESRNIMEAAARLGISQPGLSKQLMQLEQMLPGRIFTISGRKKTLTPFGLALYQRVREKVGSLQREIETAWALHASPQNAALKILGRRGILDRLSPKLRFEGSLYFEESQNAETLKALLEARGEIGIAHSPISTHELIARPLFQEEFQLVVPKSFMKRPPKIGAALLEALSQYPCIAYKPKDELTERFFASYSVGASNLRMIRATENYESIAAMVASGMGWAILPSYFSPEKSCWSLPIPGRELPTRLFYLVYRKEYSTLPWFKDLLGEIHRCF